MTRLDDLIGKKINNVVLSEDKQEIVFHTDTADYKYYAYAECCSCSWIENIEDLDSLIGQVVLKCEEKTIDREEADWDVTDIMSYDIYTEKGICKIDFRNESNGYYCGNLELVEVIPKKDKVVIQSRTHHEDLLGEIVDEEADISWKRISIPHETPGESRDYWIKKVKESEEEGFLSVEESKSILDDE